MTKAAALYNFWSSFGLTAYDESSVPTGDNAPAFPYITYQVVTDSFGAPVFMSASVWYRSESWVDANAKVEEISAAIGRGGTLLDCDGGAVWITRGRPFSQSMGDPADDMIKRKLLSIAAEYITQD